jgi:hypothetical protein
MSATDITPNVDPTTPNDLVVHTKELEIVLIVLASISLALSLFVICTYLVFKRKFPHILPLSMAICAFFLNISILIGPVVGFEKIITKSIPCLVQGKVTSVIAHISSNEDV